jgi:hypothetical protein
VSAPGNTRIRGPKPSDQGYIAATWLRQMQSHSPDEARGDRWGKLGRAIDAVLDRDDTRALIRGHGDYIAGWLVYAVGPSVPVVHFAYTRKEERGQGIAAALLAAIGVTRASTCLYTCVGPSTRTMVNVYRGATHLPLEEWLA